MNKALILPNSVVLELTYKCNHSCVFCSCPWEAPNANYPKAEEMNIEQWLFCIRKLYDYGVKAFSISGGEALLKDGLETILKFIREEGYKRDLKHSIVLISNGRAMSIEHLRLFQKYNVELSMSLPGYETFYYHTHNDNVDGVLKWFTIASEMGMSTTANITVTKKNFHELFETMSMALLAGADHILLNRFLPGGRGLHYMNELCLSPNQLKGMLEIAEEVLSLSNRYGSVGTEFPICLIDDLNKYPHINIGTKCAAAKSFFVVGPSGEIRICNHSPIIVGNIQNEIIIQNIDYWNKFASSNYKPDYCIGCDLIKKCDCGCREVAHILNGNINDIDPCISSLNL